MLFRALEPSFSLVRQVQGILGRWKLVPRMTTSGHQGTLRFFWNGERLFETFFETFDVIGLKDYWKFNKHHKFIFLFNWRTFFFLESLVSTPCCTLLIIGNRSYYWKNLSFIGFVFACVILYLNQAIHFLQYTALEPYDPGGDQNKPNKSDRMPRRELQFLIEPPSCPSSSKVVIIGY